MATTHDATSQTPFAGTRPSWGGPGALSVVKLHVDMSAVTTSLAATVDGSAADVLQVWDIPVGTAILGCLLKVTTAEGATCTCAVGTNAGANTYIVAGTNLNSTSTIVGTAATDTYGAARMVYATTDTLDVVFATDTDIDTCVFDIYVYCVFNQDVWA